MIRFEKVKGYENDETIHLPVRKTKGSAGYDFEVSEDIEIPSFDNLRKVMVSNLNKMDRPYTLKKIERFTKSVGARPTLVPTKIKCKLPEGKYLKLVVRSSCPLKYFLILANSEGIIDKDYYSNPDNDGEIFFQIINLAPFPIQLKKGDIIGQGIVSSFDITYDDATEGERTGGFGSTSK